MHVIVSTTLKTNTKNFSTMEFILRLLFSFLFFISIFSWQGLAGGHNYRQLHSQSHRVRPTKLFVFGDSYVDTGNIPPLFSPAQKFPYGITFPGKPDGRFSDGRVLTDFTAKQARVKLPIPFSLRSKDELKRLNEGINFAFGGTGVFDTSTPLSNLTTQIDMFQELGITDVNSSLALVSISGNDYSSFLSSTKGSSKDFGPFIASVVNQTRIDLKRINSLGVNKIVVTGLGPLGCYPVFTAPFSFKKCNETTNSLVELHNFQLNQAVQKLNKEAKGSSFVVLDVYSSFMPIIQGKRNNPQLGIEFKTPLQPCCFGVSSEFSCGSVDEKENKKFVLCEDRKSAFFWDNVHPTQQGWHVAFSSFKSQI